MQSNWNSKCAGLAALAAIIVAGCAADVNGAAGGASQEVAVAVDPTERSVAPNERVQITATVTGTEDTAVIWSVEEPTGGSVSASGLYVAPGADGTFHVVATSRFDSGKSAIATIEVRTQPTPPPPPPPPPTPLPPAPAEGAAMTTANRTSGVAPLAVFFDAVDTMNEGSVGTPSNASAGPNWPFAWTSGVFQPADIEGAQYEWWFDDANSGVWGTDGLSKNTAMGFTVAHVFETVGPHTVTLRVTSPDGRVDTYKQTITVTEFAGATHYASASGTGDGTSSSTPQSFASGWAWVTGAPGRRLLLNRGDTFNLSGTLSIPTSRAGMILGAYGTGARPVLSYSGDVLVLNSTDVTIMDVDFSAPAPSNSLGIKSEAAQRQDRLLVLRSKITNHSMGILTECYGPTISNPNTGMVFQEVESDGANQGTTKIGLFLGGYQIAVMGCNAHDSTSHNIRLHTAAKAFVAHNVMGGSRVGTYQHGLKIHASEFERNGSCESRWIVVSDNVATYPAPWVISVGPQDGGTLERVSHVVLERNRTLGDPGTGRVQAGVEISARHVMMRNNIFDGTGGSSGYTGALVQRRGIEPSPYDIRFLNNTVVRRDGVNSFAGVSFADTDRASVRNNVAWAPSASSRTVMSGSPTNLTNSNNLAVGTDPLFKSFSGQDFTLASASSPAVDAGVTLGEVRTDFRGNTRPIGASSDLGAFECF